MNGPVRRFVLPVLAGVLGATLLAGVYFGIVSWVESPGHAWTQFREDALYVVPILLGFGFQTALYVVLRWRLYLPTGDLGASGALTGVGGSTSAAAMVACCAHHLTDVLPILGLTAATAFLAQYREAFMLVGLGSTIVGSGYMLRVLLKDRRMVLEATGASVEAVSS
jgi:hypothetical protein